MGRVVEGGAEPRSPFFLALFLAPELVGFGETMSGARFRTGSGGVAASPRQGAEGSLGPDGAIACSQIPFAAVWALARLSDAASRLFTEPLAEDSTFDLGKS